MNPVDVAKTILDNVLSEANSTVADIIIERNQVKILVDEKNIL